MSRKFLLPITIAFTCLSGVALWKHGYLGIWKPLLTTWSGVQVLADLLIALFLVLSWLYKDARAKGRAYVPWVIVTLLLGSFGPLFYLLTSPSRASAGSALQSSPVPQS
ncbi:MAG TPA: DUF2834 domain-containing protein [Phycisphaerales bacterium]|nr:DUF2834 domain-containing protein [Phycisphaerales bacterium]